MHIARMPMLSLAVALAAGCTDNGTSAIQTLQTEAATAAGNDTALGLRLDAEVTRATTGEAATLTSAKAYTDAQTTLISTAATKAATDALGAAKVYADAQLVAAKAYTDQAVKSIAPPVQPHLVAPGGTDLGLSLAPSLSWYAPANGPVAWATGVQFLFTGANCTGSAVATVGNGYGAANLSCIGPGNTLWKLAGPSTTITVASVEKLNTLTGKWECGAPFLASTGYPVTDTGVQISAQVIASVDSLTIELR